MKLFVNQWQNSQSEQKDKINNSCYMICHKKHDNSKINHFDDLFSTETC